MRFGPGACRLQGFFIAEGIMTRIAIYDTTLRDGRQGEGVNFSLQDKLLITRRLDELGVVFIEGSYPPFNPKEVEYFQEVCNRPLRNANIAAFGMIRRKVWSVADDTSMISVC